HRVALDHIRRQKIVRFLPWTGESRGAAPSTERLVMDAHLSADLQRALARIPERQRAALLLAELHDLTGLQLAAALGVSHVAARSDLSVRLDGVLDPGEARWLENHVADCTDCRALATAYEADRTALRGLREHQPLPPRDLWARTAAAIEQESRFRDHRVATE